MNQIKNTFLVEGVMCVNCKNTIEKQKNILEQKLNISFDVFFVDVSSSTLTIEVSKMDGNFYPRFIESLKFALENIGHPIVKEISSSSQFIETQSKLTQQRHLYHAILSLIMGLFYIFISCGLFIIPGAAWLTLCSSLLMGYLAWPFIQSAWFKWLSGWKDVKKNSFFNMDSLFVISAFIVVVSSLGHLFFPTLPSFLEAGFLIFGFRHLGCLFQAYLDKKLNFKPLGSLFSEHSYLLKSGERQFGRLLKPGDIIVLKPGDILPIDAHVLTVSADLEVRDTLGTGSYLSITSPKQNETVEAGVELLSGELIVQLLSVSRFEALDNALKKIQGSQQESKLQQQIEYALQWFIPGIIFLSLLIGFVIAQFFPIALALKCVCSILVSACPCTLGLIIPMAMQMGGRRAIQKKIIFQTTRAMELAARVDTYVFDYHGTLSKGEVSIGEFVFLDHGFEKRALEVLRTIEEKMLAHKPNLIGQALLNKLITFNEIQSLRVEENAFQHLFYAGQLIVDEGTYWFGNNLLLEQFNMNITAVPNRLYLCFKANDSEKISCLLFVDIFDALKCDAKQTIDSLKQKHKQVKICTGADEQTALKIAEDLNLSTQDIFYKASIEQKSDYIRQLKNNHPNKIIAMIGDAINDSYAFLESDISVLLKNNAQHVIWQSNIEQSVSIIISSGLLKDVSEPFDIAEATEKVIWQNLYFSMFYNLFSVSISCVMLLAVGVSLPPSLGVIFMIIQSALLVWNTYHQLVDRNYNTDTVFSRNTLAATN